MATVTAAHEISLRFPLRIDSPRVDTSRLPSIIRFPLAIVDYLRRNLPPGVRAYCVGGTARDLLLGRMPNDWDLSFIGIRREGLLSLPQSKLMRNATETLKIFVEGMDLEATPLENKGLDPLDPTSLERDLLQDRDLTINSIAIDLFTGEVIDPLNGMRDLQDGIIRFAGDGQRRIDDSPIRLLRACRFASALGFRLAPETLDLIRRNAPRIRETSVEREGVKRELDKILKSEDPALALEAIASKGLLTGLSLLGQLLERAAAARDLAGTEQWRLIKEARSFLARMVIMLREIGFRGVRVDELNVFMEHYRFSNEEKLAVIKLLMALEALEKIETIHPSAVRRVLSELVCRGGEKAKELLECLKELLRIYSPNDLRLLSALSQVENILRNGDALTTKELGINGRDWAEAGLEGREIGQAQKVLLELVLNNPALNVRERLVNLARLIKMVLAISADYPIDFLSLPGNHGKFDTQAGHLCEMMEVLASQPEVDRLPPEVRTELQSSENRNLLAAFIAFHDIGKRATISVKQGKAEITLAQYLALPSAEQRQCKINFIDHGKASVQIIEERGIPVAEELKLFINLHMQAYNFNGSVAALEKYFAPLGEALLPRFLACFYLDVMAASREAAGTDSAQKYRGAEDLLAFYSRFREAQGMAGRIASFLQEATQAGLTVQESEIAALKNRTNMADLEKSITEIKERLAASQASVSMDQLEALSSVLAFAGIEAGIITLVIQKIREGRSLVQIYGDLGREGHGKKVGAVKKVVTDFASRRQS